MKMYKENDWLYIFMQLTKGSVLSVFLLMGIGTQVTAWEHPDGSSLFELDGNIADNATVGDDWQNVEDGNSSAFSTTHDDGTGGGILHDELRISIFTGGGSKDVRDVPQWKWTHGSVPDKDEIMHAAAAAYKAGLNNDELMIYLMGDRYSTDGSAQMGVWFFQEKIILNDDGTFSGKHKNGDVLMLAEFTQGGAKANIKLYKWNDAEKINLELFHEGQGDATHYFLALSNGENTPAWPDYTPKSGTQGIYPPNAFFEGGINLSWVFGGLQLPCFSSFLMETRSSHRVNAQLKDFVLGDLDTCKLEVTKECLSSVVNTNTYNKLDHTYEYNVTNSGFGTIDSVSFTDDAGTPNDTSDDHLIVLDDVGPLAIGQTISNQYTYTSNMNPPTNTIYATGEIGEYSMATVQDSATCTKVIQNPAISVTKECEQTLESNGVNVVVRIDYNGVVCNDQNGTKLINVYVNDDVSGDSFGPFELYPADDPAKRKQCETYAGTYYPTETTKVCAKNSTHSNTVTATGTGSLNGVDVNATATASCSLCDSTCNEPTP
ncbi:hypothetical protein [Sulfurovum sp.]|uniref:hypothetical protein n=1 Tax=Sulfurovum sp. TaxID=1969726 RepID=UPI003565EB6F